MQLISFCIIFGFVMTYFVERERDRDRDRQRQRQMP